MTMRAHTEAMRALAYVTAAALDNAQRTSRARRAQAQPGVRRPADPDRQGLVHRDRAGGRPTLGVQVHGGMGFIEETGAAQHLRDARIIDDLRGHDRHPGQRPRRPQDGARRRRGGARGSGRDRQASRRELARAADADLQRDRRAAAAAATAGAPAASTGSCRRTAATRAAHAAAVPYLKLWGLAAGGWQMGRAALAAARRAWPR